MQSVDFIWILIKTIWKKEVYEHWLDISCKKELLLFAVSDNSTMIFYI